MTTTYYASGGSILSSTSGTPTNPTFIPPALVVKNVGNATFSVRRYTDVFEGDAFVLKPGEWVSIAIPEGETYKPGLVDADSTTGSQAMLLGWTDE